MPHEPPPALAAWSREREWQRFTDGSPAVWRFADNRREAPPLVLLPVGTKGTPERG